MPSGATVLLKFSATTREAATPNDLDAEAAAAQSTDTSKSVFGSHSISHAGLTKLVFLVGILIRSMQ